MKYQLSEISQILKIPLQGDGDVALTGLTIDSRQVKPGELFIAIHGKNNDGNEYVNAAFKQGAAAAIVSNELLTYQGPVIVVDDTIKALGKLAKAWREKNPVAAIAVTGSSGKTTTKEIISALLASHGPSFAGHGNFNNHIGLSLNLLQLRGNEKTAVFEMGANHAGEIRYLTSLVNPSVAMIINIGPAHLEGFGTIQGVAKAKSEIFESLIDGGIAILNADCENTNANLTHIVNHLSSHPLLKFGESKNADIRVEFIELDQQLHPIFNLHCGKVSETMSVPLVGRHNMLNAAAAITAFIAIVKLDEINATTNPKKVMKFRDYLHSFNDQGLLTQIKQALLNVNSVNSRMTILEGINASTIIDDTYNANPSAVAMALSVLRQYSGTKVFVLGDLSELGSDAKTYMQDIGKLTKSLGIDYMLTVGKVSEIAANAFGESAKAFDTQDALLGYLKPILNNQTAVLVKGSRSAAMENVVKPLLLSSDKYTPSSFAQWPNKLK